MAGKGKKGAGGRPTIMTDETIQKLEQAKLDVLDYFYDSGAFDDRVVKKSEGKRFLKTIASGDLIKYIFQREFFIEMRLLVNEKFTCQHCGCVKSSLNKVGRRVRHCYACVSGFAQAKKQKARIQNWKRKKRVSGTCDGSITVDALASLIGSQGGDCVYCGSDLNETGMHLDHIYPLSKGGKHTIKNVQYLCPKCNLTKYAKVDYA